MESEIIKMAAGQGLFAVLFVTLLFYVLRDGRQREEKNQKVIEGNQKIILELTEKFCIIDDIRVDVDEIKQEILKR